MKNYQGMTGDQAIGAGAFIEDKGYGHEIFNFSPCHQKLLGFVQVSGHINLQRLGAPKAANEAREVTVVFVAPKNGIGPYVIVGWYLHATLYREYKLPPEGQRIYKGEPIGFNIEAAERDGYLIKDVDARTFLVPKVKKAQSGRQGFGTRIRQSSLNFFKKFGPI